MIKKQNEKEDKIQEMVKKFNPTEGIKVNKIIDKPKNHINIKYDIKGDEQILDFLYSSFYTIISYVTQGRLSFDVVRVENSGSFIIIKDREKTTPYLLNDKSDIYFVEYPIINLEEITPNSIVISLLINKSNVDISDLYVLKTFESIFKELEKNKNKIKEHVKKIDTFINTEDLLDAFKLELDGSKIKQISNFFSLQR